VFLRYRQVVTNRAMELYWARQCAQFTAPADTPLIVQPTDMEHARRLGLDRNYVPVTFTGGGNSQRMFQFLPYCWRRFGSSSAISGKSVFLHELRTPAGKRRIVYVHTWIENAAQLPRGLAATVVEPPSLTKGARVLSDPRGFAMSGQFVPALLSFGQPDPHDPSRFTIEWRTDENYSGAKERGVIDGRLGDDDQVHFTVRRTPTTLDTAPPSP
jgi:hypothetical protein